MTATDIPDSKRSGLPVDLDRLTADGDDWLSPGKRYALKTHGVCAQAQPHVFMIRCRTGGSVDSCARHLRPALHRPRSSGGPGRQHARHDGRVRAVPVTRTRPGS